jgi:chromosome segregation ATPase
MSIISALTFHTFSQALREASERLDASAAHSQEKLNSALAIAASLRQLLEEKDGHVAALEAERQAGELDLGEAHRKVAAANQTLRDAVDARESRIRELEAQARQYQQEVGIHSVWNVNAWTCGLRSSVETLCCVDRLVGS